MKIHELVNSLNVGLQKPYLQRVVRYNKYTDQIINELIRLGYIEFVRYNTISGYVQGNSTEINTHIVYKVKPNAFRRVIYFKPFGLAYNKANLVRKIELLNKKYDGTVLLNTNKGIVTNTNTGGQIILYVY